MGEVGSREMVVAVVDDQSITRALFGCVLRHAFVARGVQLLEGASAADTVALQFGTPAPDLLIVNGEMPGMDGAEAVAEIRRRESAAGLPRVPIVIESGGARHLDAGMSAGADARMESPFDRLSGVFVETVRFVAPLVARPPAEPANTDA